MVGGDDSRLYYLYPDEFLRNYAFHVISNNTLGSNSWFMPVSYAAPIYAFLLILKQLLPALNTQMVAYGFILSCGFIFSYLFFDIWSRHKTSLQFFAHVVCSLFYITSVYLQKTLYGHQLIPIFLIGAVPAALYLFVRSVRESRLSLALLSSLVYSVFSASVLGLPWFLPVCLTMVPFLMWLCLKHTRSFLLSVLVFAGSYGAFNAYWIVEQVIPYVVRTGEKTLISTVISESVTHQNIDVITSVSHLNDPMNQMVNYLRTAWDERLGTTFLQALGFLYLAIIIVAGTVLSKVKKEIRIIYIVGLIGLLLTMFLISPNLGTWHTALIIFLTRTIPLFGAARNMYDKFGLALAFHYAFALSISLSLINTVISRRFTVGILVLLFVLTLVRAQPLLVPTYHDEGYSTRISALNTDYLMLTKYVASLHTTKRFVWLPLTFPGYVFIGDNELSNHFYTGLSPLQLLAGASDLAGYYGFSTALEPTLSQTIYTMLQQKKFDAIARILQEENVGYVIENHEQIPPVAYAFLGQFNYILFQTEAFKNIITGEKVKDFGSRYTLYKINNKFSAETLSVSDMNGNPIEGSIAYRKGKNGTYDVTLKNIPSRVYLVMLETYHPLWQVQLVKDNQMQAFPFHHSAVYSYGNQWLIDSAAVDAIFPSYVSHNKDGLYTMTIRIRFLPSLYVTPSIILSVVSAFAAIIYVVYTSLVNTSRKKN
jgi:hypothetical protein